MSIKVRDEYPRLIEKIDDHLAELLVKAGQGRTQVLSRMNSWGDETLAALSKDLKESPTFAKEFFEKVEGKPELVDSWKKLDDLGTDIIPDALRRDPNFISKFDDVAKNNTLGLDSDGIGDLLSSPTSKGQVWDSPDAVLDAVKRSSDANIDGVSLSHKKFPEPSEGNESFVLKNAKQYQKEASGDAALSFDKNGTSWDDIASDGKLVDRKYGHGKSMFKEVDDGFGGTTIEITNSSRATSSLEQATRQVNAADGNPIRWEVSTELGAKGLRKIFQDSGDELIQSIEVVHVPQVTIIP